MLKEALEYIVGMKEPHFHTTGPREWSDRLLHAVSWPPILPATVTTLGGLCDLADIQFESLEPNEVVAHVISHKCVELVSKKSDDWSRRTVFARADLLEVAGFPFGTFIDRETFTIKLQSLFTVTATPDRDYLIHLASNITSERIRTDEDDGISQTVTLSAGVTLKTDPTAVKSRVSLAPYRTFREVAQPPSEFIFRLRNSRDENEPPTLALFEADGGAWTLAAMQSIGEFLRSRLNTEIAVVI
jgi:hypothetical protein